MSEDNVGELMTALGDDGFFALVEAHAGVRLYVPEDLARSELPKAIGFENAARLSKLYPCGYIKVPLARPFRALRYREAGMSNRDIARRLGLTESGVEKLLKRARTANPGRGGKPKDPRQLELL
ncbi:winged helix-turn-helix transcriptional regulator [Rhizobium rosettiformans]|uniref:Winged helix-turn-helix transcriptional regulator n=1 Tax=Rhizobium rosettiformans TaxID=1368430 RepID=A0ABX7ETL2_9HYPH|nr:sigma factor-like helix-turn-helix DNA-binding protein [Rhizobium rosettiformans]QRF51660.1 winged helix-turn-helix transcriptional regulator [Rhizobium rosettiformans]